MITDIFVNRYQEFDLGKVNNSFFVQLYNLYDDHTVGVHGTLLDKIDGYPYSSYIDEHARIIVRALKKTCNELGYKTLYKREYSDIVGDSHRSVDYRTFEYYTFDTSIAPIEKLSFFEILFRDTENHLLNEIEFLKTHIPEYESRSQEIKKLSEEKKTNYHNDGEEKLKKAYPQLESKILAIEMLRDTISKRLKQHKIPLSYNNGYFQKATDPLIEETIEKPFWELLSDPKYKNVEKDMLEARDTYDSNGRDPAFYAAKALESMIKITCKEKNLVTGEEKLTANFISLLNAKKNGPILINDERDELLAMLKIRNNNGAHGPGDEPMPELNDQQALRYIHSAMVWIYNLSKR